MQTKRATGQTSGISLSPAQACSAIRAGVAAALAQRARARPLLLEVPVAVRLQTQTPALADLFCQWPSLSGWRRSNSASMRPRSRRAVRMLNCLSAMSTLLR